MRERGERVESEGEREEDEKQTLFAEAVRETERGVARVMSTGPDPAAREKPRRVMTTCTTNSLASRNALGA